VIARLLREHGAKLGRELFEGTEEYAELERAAPGAGRSLASSQFGRLRVREYAAVLESLAGDAPSGDQAPWRELRIPALALAFSSGPLQLARRPAGTLDNRNGGQPLANKLACLSRFCNAWQPGARDVGGLWLRRSRVRAPSVTLAFAGKTHWREN
jgi:hypothetical protein